MALGLENLTVLGGGELMAGRRKRPVSQLPDLADYEMDALNPEGRVRKKRVKPVVDQVPTVLDY